MSGHRGQKTASQPLGLQLKTVVVLETKLKSSVGPVLLLAVESSLQTSYPLLLVSSFTLNSVPFNVLKRKLEKHRIFSLVDKQHT